MKNKTSNWSFIFGLSITVQLIALCSHAGKEISKQQLSSQETDLVSRLTKSILEEKSYYMGGEFGRGFFDYGFSFSFVSTNGAYINMLWEELARIGKNGKVLDAGCGNAVLALDMYAPFLSVDNELTLATRRLCYWPEKVPQDKEVFDNFSNSLIKLRHQPPHYVGVSTMGLNKEYILANKDVFLNSRVRILTGKFFSELSHEELLSDNIKFDIITDIFGVFTYSKTLESDVYKMFSVLKVGGKLFVKSNADSSYIALQNGTKKIRPGRRVVLNQEGELKTFADWFALGHGVRVLGTSSSQTSSGFIVEKTSEEVYLPKLIYEKNFMLRRYFTVVPSYTFGPRIMKIHSSL